MVEVPVDPRAAITIIATPTSTCLKPMLKASGGRTGDIDKRLFVGRLEAASADARQSTGEGYNRNLSRSGTTRSRSGSDATRNGIVDKLDNPGSFAASFRRPCRR